MDCFCSMFTTVHLSVIHVPLDCSAWDLSVEIYIQTLHSVIPGIGALLDT